jgi:8-amino-7-oxononanoate synthase
VPPGRRGRGTAAETQASSRLARSAPLTLPLSRRRERANGLGWAALRFGPGCRRATFLVGFSESPSVPNFWACRQPGAAVGPLHPGPITPHTTPAGSPTPDHLFHVKQCERRNVRVVLPTLAEALAQELSALAARDRLRRCPPVEGHSPAGPPSRTRTSIDDRPVVSFCSNDYLGLACHPRLLEAAQRAGVRSGFGAGAARLVSGDLPEHRALQQEVAAFLHLPAALLFPTGYQANLGVISTLANGSDLVVSDAANHASIIDGCRLSRASVRVYPHLDVAAARSALTDRASEYRRRILVTESLFSMDGDIAPLADLADVARASGSALVVDEAHAIGALGPSGRGLCAAAGVVPDVLVGTFGKALGCFGAFVAGTPELAAILQNRARTFIFTTAPPPSLAAAASAALELVLDLEGDRRRARLQEHARSLEAALSARTREPRRPQATPIIPVLFGEDRRALAASRALLERGFFVQAIRPPTVPEGTARLRVTLSADHTAGEVAALGEALTDFLAHS